tara:strand:- start:958 stop:1998 length:1041 start_codon:yes stop_codon:yes gene_type:complete
MDLLNDFLKNGDKTVLENLQKNIYEMNKNKTEYWDFIMNNCKIENNVILENLNYINFKNLINVQKLDADLLNNDIIFDKIKSENLLEDILIYQKLNIEFIKKLIDLNLVVDWDKLCIYQNLDMDTIQNNLDKINWDIISENQYLTIEFIAKYKDKINWILLGKNIKITEILNDSFVDIFSEYDLSYSFIWSDSISEDKILQNLNKLNEQKILDLLEIRKLSHNFIDTIFDKYNDKKFFDAASEGQELSLDFINTHKDKIDFDLISQHQNLTFDFIKNNIDKISLKYLSLNDYLNEELFLQIYEIKDQFNDEFNWDYISEYFDLSNDSENKIKELKKDLLIQKKLEN